MSVKIYVPGDMAAISVGADAVSRAIAREISLRDLDVTVIRNGSRGMFWLEPLVEVEPPRDGSHTKQFLRRGAGAIRRWFPGRQSASFASARPRRSPGSKRQERLTFARCGITDPLSLADYIAHDGYRGLSERSRSHPRGDRRRGDEIRAARTRRRGLSHRHQMADGRSMPPPTRNTSSATPMRATAAPTPIA